MTKNIQKEELLKIIDLISSGYTIKSISQELKISAYLIVKFCKNKNLHYMLERFSKEEDSLLKENVSLTDKEIQKIFLPNRTLKSIAYRREKLNILKKDNSVSKWSAEKISLFKSLYPDLTFEEMMLRFPNMTFGQYTYLRNKYLLKQSREKEIQRRKTNGLKNKKISEIENDKKILVNDIALSDIFFALQTFFSKHANYKIKIFDFLLKNNIVKDCDKYKFGLFSKKYFQYINDFEKAKYIYEKSLELNLRLPSYFTKDQTLSLFKYWANKNNFILDEKSLLSVKSFKKIFKNTNLEPSIRKHFKYTYNFIQEFIPDKIIYPWMTSVQVPDNYWKNKRNIFTMIDFGIKQMIQDDIINSEEEVLYLNRNVCFKYFVSSPLHKNYKEKLLNYFSDRNISVDSKKINILGNIQFDSGEELSLFMYIKSLGIDISKCSKKDKYYNAEFDEYYIPDFFIFCNDRKYIIEYFGLYDENKDNKISAAYREKTKRKINFFNSLTYFVAFFPNDLLNNYQNIYIKLDGMNIRRKEA